MSNPSVYPLIWSNDVAAILDWAATALGLEEIWRDPSDGAPVEHGELEWHGGRISVNVRPPPWAEAGPSGIALHLTTRAQVDQVHARAVDAGAQIIQGPEESFVAYGFTALDPDGNQWWIHSETGNLDALRN
ncbi:MAG: VOC family protein [bacterium]|nr:VOC family protein [bacterium]